MRNDQNVNYIFCHIDEDAFYRLSQITLKETKCENIVNTMGGFDILLVT